jgi:hypothetical protein
MRVGDLVWYQSAGYNCGHHCEYDGPALLLSFKKMGVNGKSGSTVEILRAGKDKVEEAWVLQVGLLDEWEGRNESR